VNWSALESGVVDKIFFYYAPKILGGVHSIPVVGGKGMQERERALKFQDLRVHSIAEDEFAVEAWCRREAN
jgi:diaminohydroxyphosphoribosylaminopyrimidine deaminase/5-amino-6-(5-phosphoribosylamino)uracil reductase